MGSEEFPYKVNAISLLEFSDQLKDLCLATEGKQIEVTYNDEVFSYSAEAGKQKIK